MWKRKEMDGGNPEGQPGPPSSRKDSQNTNDPSSLRRPSLCGSDLLSDAEILAGQHGTCIPIHRLLLTSASPVFKNLFETAANPNSLILIDVDLGSFQVLLRHIYGDLVTPFTNVVELLELAGRFQVKSTLDLCLERLRHEDVGGVEVLRLLEVALGLNNQMLVTKSLVRVAKNAWVLLELDEFLISSPQLVDFLLQQDSLEVMSEVQVFKSLMRWGAARVVMNLSKTVEECVAPFIKYIRFPRMSLVEFIALVVTTGVLGLEDETNTLATIQKLNQETSPNEAVQMNESRFSVKPRLYYVPKGPLAMDGDTLAASFSSLCTLGDAKTPHGTSSPSQGPLVGKFNFRVDQIAEYPVGGSFHSAPIVIDSTPWQIVLDKQVGLRQLLDPNYVGEDTHFLGVHLLCLHPTQTPLEWSFPVDGVFKLLTQNSDASSRNYCKHMRRVFRPVEIKSGFSRFISWESLVNPANGFIANNSILFEAEVTVGSAILNST